MERPILFRGSMVRAILDGRKTQTRRVLKQQPTWENRGIPGITDAIIQWKIPHIDACPYGLLGDRLWVRETWALNHIGWGFSKTRDMAKLNEKIPDLKQFLVYRADGEWRDQFEQVDGAIPPWRPSIFMPRWACRLTLEIMNVRVERLQDISEEDAEQEGVIIPPFFPPVHGGFRCVMEDGETPKYRAAFGEFDPYRLHFSRLWDEINGGGPKAWAQNPWVWVVEFKRVKP